MKRKLACGIAFCLALVLAGCGKGSEEQQAANYYQNELGMDKEDAEDLAHELYGKDEDEPSITEEGTGEIVVEPLPELLNSEWYEEKVQIYDMVFSNNLYMTEEDVRRIVGGSAYEVELTEGFDSDGNVVLKDLMVDGKRTAQLWANNRGSLAEYGLLDDGAYYSVGYGDVYMEDNWYDKSNTEFADLETRDDVLAYLAANGFVEVEEKQAVYYEGKNTYGYYTINKYIYPDKVPEGLEGITDTPHYFAKGAQNIMLYRVHKLGETDQTIDYSRYAQCSGCHLNLVNAVIFQFDTDGTVLSVTWGTNYSIVYGERI